LVKTAEQKINAHVEDKMFINNLKYRSFPPGEGEGGRGL